MFKWVNRYKKTIKHLSFCLKDAFSYLNLDNKNTVNDKLIKTFYKDMKKMNIVEDYTKLVNGLDEKSINTIDLILGRIRMLNEDKFYSTMNTPIPVFSKEETAERDMQNQQVFHKIVRIADDCYKCGKYYLPVSHFEESVFFYKHNIDSLNSLDKVKNRDIVDVGGYVGDSAVLFSEYTNKKVYSFEPTTKSYNYMQKTVAMNKTKNVEIVKLGLGSKDETLSINLRGSASSILHTSKFKKSEEIKIITLDKFAQENNLDVGLIKVDVEGFEPEFLKGAVETIKKDKPAILLSIYHNAHDFFKLKVFLEELNLGYKFKIFKPVNYSILTETILIAEVE